MSNVNELSLRPQSKRNRTGSLNTCFKRTDTPETLADNWTGLKLSRNGCVLEYSNEGHSQVIKRLQYVSLGCVEPIQQFRTVTEPQRNCGRSSEDKGTLPEEVNH